MVTDFFPLLSLELPVPHCSFARRHSRTVGSAVDSSFTGINVHDDGVSDGPVGGFGTLSAGNHEGLGFQAAEWCWRSAGALVARIPCLCSMCTL